MGKGKGKGEGEGKGYWIENNNMDKINICLFVKSLEDSWKEMQHRLTPMSTI